MAKTSTIKINLDYVALKARVSKGTVSAVINDHKAVKAAKRDYVPAVMKGLNFQARGQAPNLKAHPAGKKTAKIDMPLCPHF